MWELNPYGTLLTIVPGEFFYSIKKDYKNIQPEFTNEDLSHLKEEYADIVQLLIDRDESRSENENADKNGSTLVDDNTRDNVIFNKNKAQNSYSL